MFQIVEPAYLFAQSYTDLLHHVRLTQLTQRNRQFASCIRFKVRCFSVICLDLFCHLYHALHPGMLFLRHALSIFRNFFTACGILLKTLYNTGKFFQMIQFIEYHFSAIGKILFQIIAYIRHDDRSA